MTARDEAITRFLTTNGWGDADLSPLAGDASFRRYLRANRGRETAVVMDSPTPGSVTPFVRVAGMLADIGLSVPRVLASDLEAGLLLLEDFGDRTYSAVLAAGADETVLYRLAVDVLIHKDRAAGDRIDLPTYDDARALEGVSRFTEWYAPAVLGEGLSQSAVDAFLDGWRSVMPVARAVPATLVHFDFHVDNLMALADRAGTARCGLLDFQDAVRGPVTFDLVSLLQDARRDVPPALAAEMIERYLAAFPVLDRAAFDASYAVLGAQRATRIIGTFTRLDRRDGKPGYLRHIARVWGWLERDLEHPALAGVKDWFGMDLPAARRVAPAPVSGRAA